MKKTIIAMASLALLAPTITQARNLLPAKSGTSVCSVGTGQRSPASGTEITDTVMNVRNVDSSVSISIDVFKVYDRSGNLVYDSGVSGVPASLAGTIAPHGGKSKGLRSILGGNISGPATAVFTWRTVGTNPLSTALPPSIGRKIRIRGTNGVTLAERSGRCRRIP